MNVCTLCNTLKDNTKYAFIKKKKKIQMKSNEIPLLFAAQRRMQRQNDTVFFVCQQLAHGTDFRYARQEDENGSFAGMFVLASQNPIDQTVDQIVVDLGVIHGNQTGDNIRIQICISISQLKEIQKKKVKKKTLKNSNKIDFLNTKS